MLQTRLADRVLHSIRMKATLESINHKIKMTTPPSYDWIREISPELSALDDTPLVGATPPFPWDQLAQRIAQSFEREGIRINPGEVEWRTKDELLEGMGDDLFPLHFAIPSLRGTVCWIMAEHEMLILESLLLTKESHPISFQDRDLSESFYRFFALEVLYQISQVEFDKSIAPILTSQRTLPINASLCLDISMEIQGQILWGRLIISPELRRSWVEHFAKKGPSSLTREMAKNIELIVHLEAGKTDLSLKEWQKVKNGDFITLDSCSLDAQDFTGRVMVTLDGKNIFRAKLKDGQVKILELPLYHEVNTPMAKQEKDNEDDLTDFDEDELSLGEEDDEDEDEDSVMDTDLDTDADFEDTDLEDEDHDLDDEEEEEESKSLTPSTTLEEAPQKKETPIVTQPLGKVGPVSLNEITVSLTVEVGSIQMTMQKLLELEPGNLLDLGIHPENGVDLTINGKKVGRGELLKMGGVLGVRILELGH